MTGRGKAHRSLCAIYGGAATLWQTSSALGMVIRSDKSPMESEGGKLIVLHRGLIMGTGNKACLFAAMLPDSLGY